MNERKITLVYAITSQQLMQLTQRSGAFRHHDETRRVPIEPMNQFEITLIGINLPQRLNQTKVDATASVHSESGWLVQHNQISILIDHALCDTFKPAVRDDFSRITLGHI